MVYKREPNHDILQVSQFLCAFRLSVSIFSLSYSLFKDGTAVVFSVYDFPKN